MGHICKASQPYCAYTHVAFVALLHTQLAVWIDGWLPIMFCHSSLFSISVVAVLQAQVGELTLKMQVMSSRGLNVPCAMVKAWINRAVRHGRGVD